MRKLLFSIFAMSLALTDGMLFPACTSDMAGDIERPEEITDDNTGKEPSEEREFKERRSIELTEQTRSVANGLTDFYFNFTADMLRYADAHPDKVENGNVVVSPLSMAVLLSMETNGIGQQNLAAFTDYMGVKDTESLNNFCTLLIKELPGMDSLAILELSNSMWINSAYGKELKESFASLISKDYDAEIRYESFSDRQTVGLINAWCKEKTHGLIDGFLKDNPKGLSLLLNVLYFKDAWQGHIFKEADTHVDIFHGDRGDNNVDMMEGRYATGSYAKDGIYEYVTVPFGNAAYSLEVVIPTKDIKSDLPAAQIEVLAAKAQQCEIKLTLPKFKVENNYNVSEMFESNGLAALVNLDINMFEGDSFHAVKTYRQVTSFSVDEVGAEIAAISSDRTNIVEIGEAIPIEVKVDRPFWFFIREFSTGACILSGRIANL